MKRERRERKRIKTNEIKFPKIIEIEILSIPLFISSRSLSSGKNNICDLKKKLQNEID